MAGRNKHDADDERLLARAEEALTEIKVSKGLSERHEVVLAALRIRLKGDAGSSLEDLLAAAEDAQGRAAELRAQLRQLGLDWATNQ